MFRYFLAIIGFVLIMPLLVLIVMAFMLPITISGIGYLLGSLLTAIGLIVAPRIQRHYAVFITGVVMVVVVASVRIFLSSQNTHSGLRMVTLPEGKATSWISTLIDEQDSLIFGEALFHLIGGDSNREHEDITAALSTVYSEMRGQGIFPSPIVNTYLDLQQPDHFDAIVIQPESKAQPQFAVIFLHGYMGNVTAQCWEIAQAVARLGAVTVCPSTEWRGEWWQPEGQAILQSTFEHLRSQGIHKFYLGGFSNGAFSIGHLAPQLADEKDLNGLIFIDGFINGASIRELGLPVLIIQGVQDERVSVEAARQFAEDVGVLGTYVEINSDHFVIMKEPGLVQSALAAWLEDQEAGR